MFYSKGLFFKWLGILKNYVFVINIREIDQQYVSFYGVVEFDRKVVGLQRNYVFDCFIKYNLISVVVDIWVKARFEGFYNNKLL